MISIVRDLLDAEKEADKIVNEAREQVQTERSDIAATEQIQLQAARKAGDERIRNHAREVHKEGQARLAAARKQANDAVSQFLVDSADQIDLVVNEVVAYICRSEVD